MLNLATNVKHLSLLTPYNKVSFGNETEPELPNVIDKAVQKYCNNGVDKEFILNKLKNNLSQERYLHCISVSATAAKIARENGVDEEKAALTGLVHDYAKEMSAENLTDYAKENSINLILEYKESPGKLHAPVGSDKVKKELSISDKEILRAITNHCIGSENPESQPLSDLDKILVIADKIEPLKKDSKTKNNITNSYNNTKNLTKAASTAFAYKVISNIRQQKPINLVTARNYNALIKQANDNNNTKITQPTYI